MRFARVITTVGMFLCAEAYAADPSAAPSASPAQEVKIVNTPSVDVRPSKWEWEYDYISYNRTVKDAWSSFQTRLKAKGAEGWELIGMTPILQHNQSDDVQFVLKRPKPQQ